MASRFPAERDGKVKLSTRKGHDMTWSCDIHGEPIKFYCKQHEIPLCHPCATKDHQKPCHLVNIGDVILELVRKLDEKRLEIEEMKQHLQNLESKIQTCSAFASNHFKAIDGTVNASFESKMESAKDKKGDEIRSINVEADEEIRLINERRQKRIKSCNEEAGQQHLTIKKCRAKVESETKAISEVVSKKIKDLKSTDQHAISIMDNIDARIKRIKQNDETLVNEGPKVLASLDDKINSIVHQDVIDCLDRIEREVQRTKFVEGEIGGEHYGRIDGFIGKWELVKSIHISSIVNVPAVCGLIRDDEICVVEVGSTPTPGAAYVTNISTEHTYKVNLGNSKASISSCAPIGSNLIVCGKWRLGYTGDSLDGRITLYNRQWKVISDITISRNNLFTHVFVDVDRVGMILAAQIKQSNVYVINPSDGKIVSTITMQGKEVWGTIQALSSGDIVVKTGYDKFSVISRSGEEKAVIQSDEWRASSVGATLCHVDKLTDTLYITYWDREHSIYAVDQVSCDGTIHARRIVSYKESRPCSLNSPCLVTSSGNLVGFDGDKLLVYKKGFVV
eukprot:XP_011683119.1 PREDICTED: uncharacterized protein LOC105447127 [Strongylocentrotus purpuratus]